MGLDCMARDHAPQQISQETAILACIGGKAGLFWASHSGINKCLQATQNTEIKY